MMRTIPDPHDPSAQVVCVGVCTAASRRRRGVAKMKIVSLNITIETKEKMTDKIKLDLNRSEALGIIPASSVASHLVGLTFARVTSDSRDPITTSCRDHEAGATSSRRLYSQTLY